MIEMTSRERVLAAFGHREPDKVPAWCGSSPEFWAKARTALDLDDEGLRRRLGDDFRRVYGVWRGPELPLAVGATWRSPFGVQRTGIGYGQPLSHPLAGAESSADVMSFAWPDPAWVDVSRIKADADQWAGEFAILGGDWSPFWHDVIDLVGLERLYYLMFDHPDLVSLIFQKVTDYYVDVGRAIFEAAASSIDIFFIGNDFGSQTGPLLGVDLFERFALPSLKRLIDLGHKHDLKVMLHCCGGFRPLLPLMIRAGLDGVHALQPCCAGMEPASLKRDFGSAILLNGAIDSHHVLIKGAPDFVREQTRRTLEILSRDGGYVAGASHDYILEETPLENVLAMFDTIREYRRT
jgi:uroporphyrinogen-III decarboxylase